MKVLEYNQKWLRWIGLLSKRLDEPTNDFFNSPNAYIMIISMAFTMPICGAYGVYLSREDLVRMLQAVYIVSAGIQCVGSYTSVGKNMKLVKSFINDLQNLSDNGKYFPLFSSPKNFLPLFFPLQRFFSRFFSPLKVKNVPISSRKFRFPHKKSISSQKPLISPQKPLISPQKHYFHASITFYPPKNSLKFYFHECND